MSYLVIKHAINFIRHVTFFCEIDCKLDMRQIKRIGDMIYAFLTYSRRHDTEW